MLDLSYSGKFKKDSKRAVLRGRNILKLIPPVIMLLNSEPLPPRYRDHPLGGDWEGYRDFHIEDDWIVIYRIDDDCLVMERTGTHVDLFRE
ncbi:MAG: type II toxin-antitoxin system YafQ family toxin [Synergistaceae bacterium]|nr:type II toxin-antitoxin system YafQ family toxin [Synergistaceae bacterium]